MTLVVDASVAAKWVLPEEGSDRALKLRDLPGDLIAPSLIYAETGNAVWKRVTWNELSIDEATEALAAATAPLTRIVPIEDLAQRALAMAGELDHSIYDCFYLALAERERAPLVTADRALLAKAKRAKGIEVRGL